MNWRQWIYERLALSAPLLAVIPENRIFSSGSLEGQVVSKPFLMIRTGLETPEIEDDGQPVASSAQATVWVHDNPGSYVRIDSLLLIVRSSLIAPITSGQGVACIWQGNSNEFSDNTLGTITRNASFRLVGRDGNDG
jgi:hypothetical protein